MEDMDMNDQSKVERAFETTWSSALPNAIESLQTQMRILLDEQGVSLEESQ
jgi:hypothetical protein